MAYDRRRRRFLGKETIKPCLISVVMVEPNGHVNFFQLKQICILQCSCKCCSNSHSSSGCRWYGSFVPVMYWLAWFPAPKAAHSVWRGSGDTTSLCGVSILDSTSGSTEICRGRPVQAAQWLATSM